jgi:predicted ATP-binding protein involved in virulence
LGSIIKEDKRGYERHFIVKDMVREYLIGKVTEKVKQNTYLLELLIKKFEEIKVEENFKKFDILVFCCKELGNKDLTEKISNIILNNYLSLFTKERVFISFTNFEGIDNLLFSFSNIDQKILSEKLQIDFNERINSTEDFYYEHKKLRFHLAILSIFLNQIENTPEILLNYVLETFIELKKHPSHPLSWDNLLSDTSRFSSEEYFIDKDQILTYKIIKLLKTKSDDNKVQYFEQLKENLALSEVVLFKNEFRSMEYFKNEDLSPFITNSLEGIGLNDARKEAFFLIRNQYPDLGLKFINYLKQFKERFNTENDNLLALELEAFLLLKDFESAESLLSKFENKSRHLARFGLIKYFKKDFALAEKAYKEFFDKNTPNENDIVNYSAVLIEQEKNSDAISLIESFLGKYPNSYLLNLNLGLAYSDINAVKALRYLATAEEFRIDEDQEYEEEPKNKIDRILRNVQNHITLFPQGSYYKDTETRQSIKDYDIDIFMPLNLDDSFNDGNTSKELDPKSRNLLIKGLQLQNIGPFKNVEINFIPEEVNLPLVTFITGENGTGKTIILDAIRFIFGINYGYTPNQQLYSEIADELNTNFERNIFKPDNMITAQFLINQENFPIIIENNILPFIEKIHSGISKGGPLPTWVVNYWRPGLAKGLFATDPIDFLNEGNYHNYLKNSLSGQIKNSEVYNLILFFNKKKSSGHERERISAELLLRAVERIIELSVNNVEYFSVLENKPGVSINSQFIPLENLSSGNLYMIQRMVSVLGQLYCMFMLSDEIEQDKLLETSGLLLIDEAESHLHPKWQKTFIPNILKIFPNFQIISTTHSPLIISSVENSQIFVCKVVGEGTYLEDLSGYFSNKPVNEILASHVFNETLPFNKEITELMLEMDKAAKLQNHQRVNEIENELIELNPSYFRYLKINELIKSIRQENN